ncbi:MAG: hypothetical protein ACOZE5_10030 [Verrucomicrobiota bacterium]
MAPSSAFPKAATTLWILLVAAVVWTMLNDRARIRRIGRVTGLPEWSVDAPKADPASPTGYAGGWRRLILPEHNYRSFLWIAQTQRMLAEGSWRVRHIDYENAPQGRASNLPSPYAWWLAALAQADHVLTGQPAGIAVERAALYADPLLHLLLLAGASWLAWCWLGAGSAVWPVLGGAAWFPLAGNFLPGAPDSEGLLVGVTLLGLIALLAGWKSEAPAEAERRLALAGACGGFGLWLDAPTQIALVPGLLAGALLLRFIPRAGAAGLGAGGPPPKAWRLWGLGGALVALTGYLVEYAPGDLRLRLETNHPLYALAWLGAGELLAWLNSAGAAAGWKGRLGWLPALMTVLALPSGFVTGDSLLPWQLKPDPGRISVLNNLGAEHLFAWIGRDGISLPLVAALLPAALTAGAAGLALRRGARGAAVLLAGPWVVLLLLAAWQPCWWSLWQVATLAWLLAAGPTGAGWVAAGLSVAIPGLAVLFQPRAVAASDSLSESELVGVIERDLAHSLSRQRADGRLLALAPPEMTAALHFYAGVRGLGTLAWENREGLSAAARIASATSPEEAFHLVGQRGVTHLIMPAWDGFLDDYAGLGRAGKTGATAAQNSLVAAIHRWEQPGWLRPRAYQIPPIAGFEEQRIEVFEVVDEQDAPGAMSRMAEFFVETGRLELAAAARQSLQRYPAHLGALVATAKVDAARREGAAFAGTVARLMPLLEAGGARRALPWDRRVSLAVVLATAHKETEAREQLEHCLREATEERLRSLPTQALFQLLTLARRRGLEFPSAQLGALALELLPPEARGRL